MRKILASFLAASMVASIGATMSFAANTSASIYSTAGAAVVAGATYTNVELEISFDDNVFGEPGDLVTSASVNKTAPATLNPSGGDIDTAEMLNGVKFTNVEIGGKTYTINLKNTSGKNLVASFSPAAAIDEIVSATSAVKLTLFQDDGTAVVVWSGTLTAGTNYTPGTGGKTADLTEEGISVEEVLICDGQGNPIPLTEGSRGDGNDINDDGGVQGSRTVYFMLKKGAYNFDDDLYWKLRINKGDNGKYVKAVSDVSKNFTSPLYNVWENAPYAETVGRHRYIKVELNDIYTDDEYKLTFDMRLTPTSKAMSKFTGLGDDTELKVKDFVVWMKNIARNADNDWRVGINGLMLSPQENDWNEVTWYDEDGDLAHLKFFADSDVSKFYSKLSTKWEHADYASYFNDQDAYIFDFTGSPKLSATSRADLEIYNPFIDEDGNETIDPSSAVIYQVIDGDLFDVTDSFEYKEADSGDMAYVTRTRFLGTYIICERAVEEAVDDSADVPADLVPEDTTPSEVTPGNDNGGKAPANTGRFA